MERSLPLLVEIMTTFPLLHYSSSLFPASFLLLSKPLISSWLAAEANSLPLWACWNGERVLLPEVLGKLAETTELAPAPTRRTQSPRVPWDDLDKPHLQG